LSALESLKLFRRHRTEELVQKSSDHLSRWTVIIRTEQFYARCAAVTWSGATTVRTKNIDRTWDMKTG